MLFFVNVFSCRILQFTNFNKGVKESKKKLCRIMNVELRIWNLQLVGFADYQLSNFELLFNIQYSIAKALSSIFI